MDSTLQKSAAPLIRFDRVTVMVRERRLINGISFELAEGQKAVLTGRSGAGKSTLLKALLGFVSLSRGEIHYRGEALSPTVARRIRASAAYIGQEPILGGETVREALLLPFRFRNHRDRQPDEPMLIAALRSLDLEADLLGRACQQISVGEKQRIALARGALLGKRLLLLDEVTSALDRVSKERVFELFERPDLTVLSVSHDPEWIERCDSRFKLVDGRLSEGTT